MLEGGIQTASISVYFCRVTIAGPTHTVGGPFIFIAGKL